ncbi:hypothetical protein EBU99_01830 [bacterium]|nr:hypothetical protein [bacterium]
MKQALLIIGDPVETLNFSGDSSLALAEAALELGYTVDWTTAEDVSLLNGAAVAYRVFQIEEILTNQAPAGRFRTDSTPIVLSKYRAIFVRKDPPFDESYTDLCWILSLLPAKLVINSPTALLLNHEKLTPWALALRGVVPQHAMVPTLVSRNQSAILQFVEQQFLQANDFLNALPGIPDFENFKFKMLAKPWRGHGGRGIETFESISALGTWLAAQPSTTPGLLESAWIIQPLLPEIKTAGDRRVFIVNGKVAFDFVRFPAPGKIEANLAQGGRAVLLPMSSELMNLCERIASELKSSGIRLAGLDFIDEKLTEVNITSPTGIRTFESLSGTQICKQLLADLLED